MVSWADRNRGVPPKPDAVGCASRFDAWIVWRVALSLLVVAVAWTVAVVWAADEYQPVARNADGTVVAWAHPGSGLLLGLGVGPLSGSNLPLAHRAAVLDAQRQVIRAYAALQGRTVGTASGTIRMGRVVVMASDAATIRVYYLARLADIVLR